MNRRRIILIGVAACLLIAAIVWSCRRLANARRAALAAEENLAACRGMVAQIGRHNQRPAMASDHERLAAETTGRIERAAKAARVDARSLVRITPEPARRVGDTAYKEKPTSVLLKGVTLKQLVGLMHRLSSDRRGLAARSIRIAAPRAEDTGATWNAELTLTYLIYDPPRTGNPGVQ